MKKICQAVKGVVVTAVEKAETAIHEGFHGTDQGARGSHLDRASSATTSARKKATLPSGTSDETMVMSNNSGVTVNYYLGSSGPPTGNISVPVTGLPLGGNSGGKFVLKDNSNIQLHFAAGGASAGPSGASGGGDTIIKGNSHTQMYAESGIHNQSVGAGTQGGKFTFEGNKRMQACLVAGGVSAGLSAASHGEISMKDNVQAQVYVAPGAGSKSGDAGMQASSTIANNKDSQIIDSASSTGVGSLTIANNDDSQIMHSASLTGAASSAITNNKDSQIMQTASSTGAATSAITNNKDSQIMQAASSTGAVANCINENSGCMIMNIASSAHGPSSVINNSKKSQIMTTASSTDAATSTISNNTESQIMLTASSTGAGHQRPMSDQRTPEKAESPFNLSNVSLTKRNSILIAALEHGLIEYSQTMDELSNWKPPKYRNVDSEEVVSVISLPDGRAAVGLFHSQRVVLLRKTGRKHSEGHAWTEDWFSSELESLPWRFSSYKNVLAIVDGRLNRLNYTWMPGRHVQLMELSDGRLSIRRSFHYDVRCLTVTDQAIVTVSYRKVAHCGDRWGNVVDSHSFPDFSNHLWRLYLMEDEEAIQAVCFDTASSMLYAAALKNDLNGRVVAISLIDDRALVRGIKDFDATTLPTSLSVCTKAAAKSEYVLTVLCQDHWTAAWRTMTFGTQDLSPRDLLQQPRPSQEPLKTQQPRESQ